MISKCLICLPSGPIAWTSCLILETMAKYCGKSVVRIRVILLVFRSSSWLNSEKIFHNVKTINKNVVLIRFTSWCHLCSDQIQKPNKCCVN